MNLNNIDISLPIVYLSVCVFVCVCVKAHGCIKRGKMLYAGAENKRVRETENLGAGATAPLVLALTVRVL